MSPGRKELAKYGNTSPSSARASSSRQGPDTGSSLEERSSGNMPTAESASKAVSRSKLPKQSTNLARDDDSSRFVERHEHAAAVVGESPAASRKAKNKPLISPGGPLRKAARQVSFKLPQDAMLSSSPEPQGDYRDELSSSGKENHPTRPSVVRSAGNANQQYSASLRSVSNAVHNNGEPFKFPMVSEYFPPAISPDTPKEFKVRGTRYRKNQNNASQTLKLAAAKEDAINHGSSQGVFPALRRMVSSMTGGLA